MNRLNALLAKIPSLLSSRVSIFIYLFLFIYLVLYALLCWAVPALAHLAPPSTAQLVLGNYTNVLSALGASIAAGAGTAVHANVKKLHARHDELLARVDALHAKLDGLQKAREDQSGA